MDSNKYNGRVNIMNGPKILQFELADKISSGKPTSFCDALNGTWQNSLLSRLFFSAKNIQIIQNGIRAGVYKMSKNQYVIAPQSIDSIKVIMRSIYLQNSANQACNITEQLRTLNLLVVDYCQKKIYGEVQGYLKYIEDVSTLPTPIQRPIMSTTTKSLEFKRFF